MPASLLDRATDSPPHHHAFALADSKNARSLPTRDVVAARLKQDPQPAASAVPLVVDSVRADGLIVVSSSSSLVPQADASLEAPPVDGRGPGARRGGPAAGPGGLLAPLTHADLAVHPAAPGRAGERASPQHRSGQRAAGRRRGRPRLQRRDPRARRRPQRDGRACDPRRAAGGAEDEAPGPLARHRGISLASASAATPPRGKSLVR